MGYIIIVAFQCSSSIVASAILVGQSLNGKIKNGVEYEGFYKSDSSSFFLVKNLLKIKRQRI